MATGNKSEVTWCFMPSQPVRLYEREERVREVLYKEDADKYRRMAGLTEISCKEGAENIGIVGRIFGVKYR